MFHIFGAVAEFERNLIRERTMAALKAARRQGRTGGHPTVSEAGPRTPVPGQRPIRWMVRP